MPVAAVLVQIAGRLTADSRLYGCIDVPRREPEACRPGTIDIDADGRLSQRIEDRQVGDTRQRLQHITDLACRALEQLELVAEELDGVLALDSRGGLFDVVLNVLREVEIHAGEFLLQGGSELRGQFVLVGAVRPGIERLQGDEKLGVEETS